VTFSLTPKQQEAQSVLASDATHVMLFGGSRSGKTFLIVRNLVMRALKAPKSRHAMFRYRFNAIKSSVIQDTFPKVMDTAFKGLKYELNKTDNFATLPNGSEIWFAGLDEKERAEKVLGMEFVTIALNECSQIPKASRDLVLTRLAQQVMQVIPGQEPKPLKPRMYYDENPPSKGHWSYKLFIQKLDPDTKEPLTNPADYAWFKINPQDNEANISDGYLDTLRGMSARFRKRFLEGEFTDDNPNALFSDSIIETWRVMDGAVPQMVRVVVAVDPSGSDDEDNADNDAIGIVVAGLGIDGNAYVLEDCTVKAGPATWGRIATDAYDRHKADCIVGEINYGGAMVRQTIQTARPRTPFKQVTATRGKSVRAEPFSALYEQGKVRHVGLFPALEDELTAFSTFGYTGSGSPNRADAAVWALSELFPGIVAGPRVERKPRPVPQTQGWAA
jgi:Phage terminase large subunit/Terminase RNaseH-like domain